MQELHGTISTTNLIGGHIVADDGRTFIFKWQHAQFGRNDVGHDVRVVFQALFGSGPPRAIRLRMEVPAPTPAPKGYL